jgi:hypothetical protein
MQSRGWNNLQRMNKLTIQPLLHGARTFMIEDYRFPVCRNTVLLSTNLRWLLSLCSFLSLEEKIMNTTRTVEGILVVTHHNASSRCWFTFYSFALPLNPVRVTTLVVFSFAFKNIDYKRCTFFRVFDGSCRRSGCDIGGYL